MARRAPRSGTLKFTITFRLPDGDRARLEARAAEAGLTLSAYVAATLDRKLAEQRRVRVTSEPVEPLSAEPRPGVSAADPALLAELRRIGNNVNQVAHCVNSGLPPHVQNAYDQMARLLDTLTRDEVLAREISALRMRTAFNGSAPSQAGHELQRGVRVYPARSGQDEH